MSKLADMLAKTKPITSLILGKDVYAEETGLGLGGMTSKITPLDRRDTLAQEGTGGLSSMSSTYQSKPGGTTTPKGESSDVKTT